MRSKFTGFVDVFKFAYQQTVKTTAYKVTLAILCVVALISFPVMTLISGSTGDEHTEEVVTGAEHIGTIYIEGDFKEGALAKAVADDLKKSEIYGGKEIIVVNAADYDETFKIVEDSTAGDVLVHIEYEDDITSVNYGFMYSVYYGNKSKNVSGEASELSIYVDRSHENLLTAVVSGSAEAGKYVSAEYSWDTLIIGADDTVTDAEAAYSLSISEYWITYAFLMIAIFTISISGSRVGEQLVTEKSNKVIEYIMTSVKPMALIAGKVVASVATIFLLIGCLVVSFIASGLINGLMFKNPDGSMAIPELLQAFLDTGAMKGANPINIIILVLLLVGGFVFYGFLGGIAGATVSKVEEMAEGMKLYTFVMIVGAYLPLFLVMGGTMGAGDPGVFGDVIMVLPISSVFITPGYLLLGKITTGMAAIALLVMLVSVVAMMFIVSTIFETLIYYNGNPMKFKDIMKIFKDKRRAK